MHQNVLAGHFRSHFGVGTPFLIHFGLPDHFRSHFGVGTLFLITS